MLLLLGETDYLNPPDCACRFIERAGQGRLEIHDQQPQRFREVVGAFLAGLP